MVKSRSNAAIFRRWSTIPLRLIVGYGFIAHGYAKLINEPAHFADLDDLLSRNRRNAENKGSKS